MEFKAIGIIGSGIMGAGIAETIIEAGHRAILRSRNVDSASAMVEQIRRSFDKKIGKGLKNSSEADQAMTLLSATIELSDLANCDLVIESVVEDLEVKRHLFRELDKICGPASILASNTSTLPVIELAAATHRPDRVCGIHFFNPAPVMKIVEVARTLVVAQETIDIANAFVRSCGKEPIEVRDQAGFIVNALLFPYLNNAVRLLEQGVATKEGIDAAMKGGCGFPMGPFALLDLVGLDTSLAILESLYNERKDTNYSPAPLLRTMVSANMLGRKTKIGFYNYQ